MLFNSLQFAIFFAIVYALYVLSGHKRQNRILLVTSYVFYGAWDWRFLSLIWISTILDYFCGIRIHESDDAKRRRLFLFFSVFGNLAILGFFKYFNFFALSLQSLLGNFGFSIQPRFLNVILPVGISFYTFQTMSYTIDIYKRKMEPTKRFLDFALFVAFFPQLVAGPIERAKHLLPQILSPRRLGLDKFYDGCYLIFWGLFQKVVIADNLAEVVDPIFAAGPPYNGAKVLLGLYAFSFQIFCDFAGYSNIARGLGKCMGFDIMVNFRLPYIATNPREFWRRWHISLSTWLRDYLYIPLGGNKKGAFLTYRNLAATMLLGGLWHGAAWTFVIWGAYHGVLLIIHRLLEPILKKIPLPKGAFTAKACFFIRAAVFFHLVCLGWLIFRAQSMTQVFQMLQALFAGLGFAGLQQMALKIIFFLWLLIIIQLFQYWKDDLEVLRKANAPVRAAVYFISYYLLVMYGVAGGKEFIYFQF
jgi:alginate O-acetyltransferase complex protein AlgI